MAELIYVCRRLWHWIDKRKNFAERKGKRNGKAIDDNVITLIIMCTQRNVE